MATTSSLHAATLFSLRDHVCLVTGGGTGIGLMASQALAANGAKVYITGRRESVLRNAAEEHSPHASQGNQSEEKPVGQIIPIGPCDVTSKSELEALVSQIQAKEKYLSHLITAAGVPGPKASPSSSDAKELKDAIWNSESVADWADTYTSDVTSVYFSVLAFLPLLAAAPKSHNAGVTVISSMSGLMRDSQAHFAYNAAKAATAHLSRMMSKEFDKVGVRVNSIAPGYFPSEMTMKESDGRNKTDMPDGKVKDKGHEVPAGRSGRDGEMGMLVLFLACCGYVNGQIVALDGGVLNEVGS